MKLTAGITAALASCAAAATATGQAFIFPRDEAASTASLGRSLARLVFLQRLGGLGEGPTIRDVPDDISVEDAVATLNKFGAARGALFTSDDAAAPKRLLVIVDGMTEQQMEDAGNALSQDPAFTIDDIPSSDANGEFLEIDAFNAGAATKHGCSLGEIVQMKEPKCWSESASAARYSVSKDGQPMADILKALRSIPNLAKAGSIEATVILLPESSTDAKSSWSDMPQELRRRQAEQVISSHNKVESVSSTHPAASTSTPFVPRKPIPSCFSSETVCIAATGNCSYPNGKCENKYGKVTEGTKPEDVCFTCRCFGTKNENSGPTYWAGPTCAKQDVSVPFWLLFGFTVVIVGIVWMSISLLFRVGEEKLPGVIGAGVSRSK